MPRLRLAWPAGPGRRLLRPALGAAALALPPPMLHAALASAAGTVIEATPFVLVPALLGSARVRRLAGFVSCGCGGVPGALTLPALALCWLSFGPALALTRLAVAAAIFALLRRSEIRRSRCSATDARDDGGLPPLGVGPDPLAELTALAVAAFAAGIANQTLLALGADTRSGVVREALLWAAGAGIGLLGPCASGAIATASALRAPAASAAAGLLATAGVFPAFRRHSGRGTAPACAARLAYGLLGLACAWLGLSGAQGFVHPRLLPAIAVAAALGLHLASRPDAPATRAPLALPLGLLAALAFGSPLPHESIEATNLADAFPGASVSFTGSAQIRGARTALVRYAITCCRADASPIALVVDRGLPVPDGTWIEANGTIAREPDGELVLAAPRWRVRAAPGDPFLYR